VDDTFGLTPLVLLVDDQEWTSRSIESILRPKGHVVLKAYTGHQALGLASKVVPDALLVDMHLPDVDGIDLLRQLRALPTIHSAVPALIITGGSVSRAEKLEALEAGAWDVLTHPVDPSELILRMETFVRAKQDADRIRDEGLTDPRTGFYNARGILRRTKEIGADAIRFDRPLTCVAFGPQRAHSEGAVDTILGVVSEHLASVLRIVTRTSDTVGCLGPGEFVVVAPGTDQEGALRLADRVLEAMEDERIAAEPLNAELLAQIRAGVCAIGTGEPAAAEDLLQRATTALRQAQSDEGSFRVREFDA
jgi:diguanylate cyclase (GGDEF)-like protein